MKKIMILGASILQLPAIQEAKKMGLRVIAVDMDPEAIGFMEQGIEKEKISTIDIPAVLEAAKRHNIDGIMTIASDLPMRTVAAVAKELGLISISENTALKVTNKVIMRQSLKEFGVPIPKFFKVSNREEYERVVKLFNSAFIVKPADNSGSRGIILVNKLDDSHFVSAAYDYSLEHSRNGDVIVEEFIKGPEVSVETIAINGECHVIQITDKVTTGAPHFVEIGHSQPTKLSQDIVDKIIMVTLEANKAMNIINGPSHTEIIITEEGPKIVELGARLGGDCITSHLVPLSTGVNMVECCIKIALGERPCLNKKINKGSAIRYFKQGAGIIDNIVGLEEAKKIKGVQQISVVHGVGKSVTNIKSSDARIGFVIAQEENANEAIKVCLEALKSVEVIYKVEGKES